MARIYVYELLDPGIYIRGRAALVELFKRWTGSPSEERLFEVTPAGMIYFADHGELWRESEQRRALPETAEDALKQAERFLNDVRDRFRSDEGKAVRQALQECPVPDGLFRMDAVAVLHPVLGLIDHWLCRFGVQVSAFPWTRSPTLAAPPLDAALAAGGVDDEHREEDPFHHIDFQNPLRVQDALFEVRIGSKWLGTDRYRIIGYNQRWRPVKASGRITTELLPPQEDEHAAHDEEPVTPEEAQPELIYQLDADSQRFLAPYYLTPSGHHFGFQPASMYSMVLNAIQRDGEQGTDLFLAITGGGKKRAFSVHWSCWRPDTLVEEGITYLGEGLKAPKGLSPAVYNVIADVIDNETGQTKRHQQTVYAQQSTLSAVA